MMAETISVFLTDEMADKFYHIAYIQNKSVSQLMRELIEDYLENTSPNLEELKYERNQVSIYTERVRCAIGVELKKALFHRARQERTEVSKLVRDIVKEYLKFLELGKCYGKSRGSYISD
jgi:metal-responsive CopG/Arc/MetJ family transcriptional regulator